MEKIRKIGGLRGLPKLPKLGEGRGRRRAAGVGRIVAAPQEPGQAEDPLEKAALQGVAGTLPERIVWKWLYSRGHLFEVQEAVAGGRLMRGGAVVDFVVHDLAVQPVAIRIQGDYWHGPTFPGRQARDDEQAARLRDLGYLVVDLWELKIYEAARFNRVGRLVRDGVMGFP